MAIGHAKLARMKQLFRVFDLNRDGHLDQQDFLVFAQRLAKLKSVAEK